MIFSTGCPKESQLFAIEEAVMGQDVLEHLSESATLPHVAGSNPPCESGSFQKSLLPFEKPPCRMGESLPLPMGDCAAKRANVALFVTRRNALGLRLLCRWRIENN